MIAEAESYADVEFSDRVLGVHYRATDKKYEAPVVDYNRVVNFIEHIKDGVDKYDKIIIATDDRNFLDYMRSSRMRKRITYFDCKELSSDGRAIHFSHGDNYRKGVEALSAIFLLSRCSCCVKTPSHLSSWAKIINPKLKVYMLEKPYKGSFRFPDKQIWEAREKLQ